MRDKRLQIRTAAMATAVVTLLVTSSSCEPDPEDFTDAKVSDDPTSPDVRIGTLQAIGQDGQDLGKWTATPSSADPGPTLASSAQVYLVARANDDDGGIRALRLFAYIDKVTCVDGDTATVTQGLTQTHPSAENSQV